VNLWEVLFGAFVGALGGTEVFLMLLYSFIALCIWAKTMSPFATVGFLALAFGLSGAVLGGWGSVMTWIAALLLGLLIYLVLR